MHQLNYGKLILCEKPTAESACRFRETVLTISVRKKAIKCHGPELCKYNKGAVRVYWEVEENA